MVGLIVAYSMYFQVSEGYKAVVTRFGDPVRCARARPGWPGNGRGPSNACMQIDVRRRVYNTPYTATLTRDQKNVISVDLRRLARGGSAAVPAVAGHRRSGRTETRRHGGGQQELSPRPVRSFGPGVHDSGGHSDRGRSSRRSWTTWRQSALAKFGIAVEQVGIKRIAYPEENITTVLQQMRAERRAEAGKLRAEGEREAQQIRDDVLVKCEEIRRQGREEVGQDPRARRKRKRPTSTPRPIVSIRSSTVSGDRSRR